ncbi:hypothetical protein PUNSTDRAFT_126977 [Punctularia strigosozonata HHB-11173 SS5]|uniref:uncharacterized protein n=1 Tax=Punctularia strigosozonata (strain HHB-11173) TaxID=741275 RepID=UPI0004417E97|nr:uncharacterized protein PUNSTDRAFT_126977 [Punctularia strigosozonata HHB-11173 SS5]EIN07157.1 hypothetical protein PUNSTDRAFT_126977 [Punctularia strigosozonata HHB-11173 SS5]
MPSLRRTYSSPSIRSSPYSRTRAGAYQPRRASGSDTLGRRVLADIDWWRAPGAQHNGRDAQPDAEGDENASEPERPLEEVLRTAPPDADEHDAVPATVAGAGEGSAESTWQAGFGLDLRPTLDLWTTEPPSPIPQFSTLSISPQSPTLTASSLNASPEMARASLVPETTGGTPWAVLGLGSPRMASLSPSARYRRPQALMRSVSESYVDLPSQQCAMPEFGLQPERNASNVRRVRRRYHASRSHTGDIQAAPGPAVHLVPLHQPPSAPVQSSFLNAPPRPHAVPLHTSGTHLPIPPTTSTPPRHPDVTQQD